ncbi:Response regulator PleD [compost metagenome]
MLREFAARIRSTVRGADLACRYGGEEFVVVMPDTPIELAASVAERLRAIVEDKPFYVRSIDRELSITASLGIATSSGAFGAPDEILKHADKALYEAKHAGRNRVVAAAA